jgi:hypothetical protein
MARRNRSGPTTRNGELPGREAAEHEREVEREDPGRTDRERGGEREEETRRSGTREDPEP